MSVDAPAASKRVICRSPCKINVFLHITGRRSDGYHDLQSVFRAVSLFDEITLSTRNDGQVLRIAGPSEVPPELDLCTRAAALLQQKFAPSKGVEISLQKRIPIGAGLGGGSSNAASVLLMLNQLWQLSLPLQELEKLALQLGADVPFFIRGGDQFVSGVGEKLLPMKLPKQFYVLLFPGVHCATAAMFSDPALKRDCEMLDVTQLKDADLYSSQFKNVFEALARRQSPAIDQAHAWLQQHAGFARLTGSGSALFAPVPTRQAAQKVVANCPAPWRAWYVHALSADQAPHD